jgi:hypothetical protein
MCILNYWKFIHIIHSLKVNKIVIVTIKNGLYNLSYVNVGCNEH